MFSHITFGFTDLAKTKAFYGPVMASLGHGVCFEDEGSIAYGLPAGQKLFLVPPFNGQLTAPGNGVHAAFIAKDRETVDAFYAVALANGGTDEGTPGPRPHYHPNYYGAYVRDPDGNKLQAVCHAKPL